MDNNYWLLFFFFILCAIPGALPAQCPNTGSIIISEIMQNPYAVSNVNGEFFELYNTTSTPIDVNGLGIRDDDFDDHIINAGGPLILEGHGYIILGRNGNMETNGGVPVDYTYAGFVLANSGDEIILFCPSSQLVIDSVEYDEGPNFPVPSGASMQLNPDHLNASDNDSGTHWCWSSQEFGDGDLGSPGASNSECGPCLPRYAQGNSLMDTVKINVLYETDGIIESHQVIGTSMDTPSVEYDSGTEIILSSNFEVLLGSIFHAFIDGCGGALLQHSGNQKSR